MSIGYVIETEENFESTFMIREETLSEDWAFSQAAETAVFSQYTHTHSLRHTHTLNTHNFQ